MGVTVRTGVLSFQCEGLLLHTGGKQIRKRCGRTVPTAGHAGHILAVGAGIDGAKFCSLGVRDITHFRIQVYTAQRAGGVLNPILCRVICSVLYGTIRLLFSIQKPDIAEPLAVGQGYGDLCIGGNRQRSLRAVMTAVGNTEFVAACNDLGAAGAGGDISIGIRQRNDRFS